MVITSPLIKDKTTSIGKANDNPNTLKQEKKGKSNMFLKLSNLDDKPDDLLKKHKDKKVALLYKNTKTSQSNEKNNTSNNNDLDKKTESENRSILQSSHKGKKERPLYSNNLNTSTTSKNDLIKTGVKRTYTIAKSTNYESSKNTNNNNNNNSNSANVSSDKNIQPTSCLSTATNSNTNINNPETNQNECINTDFNYNSIKENSDTNNFLGLNSLEESSIPVIEESKENNEVIRPDVKDENDQDCENIDKNCLELSSNSNLLQESTSSKEIEKVSEKSEETKINSSNININTDVIVKEICHDNIPIEKTELRINNEGLHLEQNTNKKEAPTTIYLKNLMVLEEKLFNILEVVNYLH